MTSTLSADIISFAEATERAAVPRGDVAIEAPRLADHLHFIAEMIDERAEEPAGEAPSAAQIEPAASASLEAAAAISRLMADGKMDRTRSLSDCIAPVCANLIERGHLQGGPRLTMYWGADCLIEARHALAVTTITIEVLLNAIRHAHPAGASGKLAVSCERKGSDRVILEIADDGVGLPEAFDASRDGGVGLRAVRALSAEIGAECSFQSSPLGLTFRLSIPAAAP